MKVQLSAVLVLVTLAVSGSLQGVGMFKPGTFKPSMFKPGMLLALAGISFGLAQESGDAAAGPATLAVSQTDELGEFLVDADGMTLYMFTSYYVY